MPTDVIYDVNYHGDDPPEEKLSKQIYLHNQHLTPFPEDDEIQFLLTNLKEGDHVLDIVANIGYMQSTLVMLLVKMVQLLHLNR